MLETSPSTSFGTCLGDVYLHSCSEFSRREISDVVRSVLTGGIVITQRVDGKLKTNRTCIILINIVIAVGFVGVLSFSMGICASKICKQYKQNIFKITNQMKLNINITHPNT